MAPRRRVRLSTKGIGWKKQLRLNIAELAALYTEVRPCDTYIGREKIGKEERGILDLKSSF